LQQAFDRFSSGNIFKSEFIKYKESNSEWLDDFTLFMALKDIHDLKAWVYWEPAFRSRKQQAMAQARDEYKDTIEKYAFYQFIFMRQWQAIREYAANKGIRIIGDIPIYVAHDSADVWANTELFLLDETGNPTVVAGVPPDYFTKTGQLWGNPIYNWQLHAERGYKWWITRMQMVLSMVDIVRMDHFRGFAGYWEVPADEDTAENGRWVKGPGEDLFVAIKNALGELPIIAEDLGVITPDVEALRDRFGLPGMKILQFAFDGAADHPYLPNNYSENTVAYTGTHDNETVAAWYKNTSEMNKHHAREYLNSDGSHIAWDMIQALWASPAVMAVAPLQDFLELGEEARMNTPGTIGGNWGWRVLEEQISQSLQQKLLDLNHLNHRSSH
jgi:4-alpha-glucanotransferase